MEEVDAVEKLMSACARLTSTQVAGYEFICDRFDAHADCGRGSAEASSDLSYGVVAENDFLEVHEYYVAYIMCTLS